METNIKSYKKGVLIEIFIYSLIICIYLFVYGTLHKSNAVQRAAAFKRPCSHTGHGTVK